jgi:hypothetical protein
MVPIYAGIGESPVHLPPRILQILPRDVWVIGVDVSHPLVVDPVTPVSLYESELARE